ncbi:MAG TPA: LysR family transcriptional regulator [Candidatus Dormibacteraeota bacterium]|nr:LysR family transcriptional regulator [Candidatus Dormibacteraeota bacterium]
MRRPAFTLEQIRSFVAVADKEHISQAAASLFLTQAAVTQQIRHFERAVGLQLLERAGRRVRLTDAGRRLAETCRAALRSVEVVEDSALSMRQLRAGSLELGASPTCATYYLPPYLSEFVRQHPGIRLGMSVEPSQELNRRVLVGTLDCALIEADPDPQLLAVEVAHDELILVAHRDHPLARLARIGDGDFTQYLYLGRGSQWPAERTIHQMLGGAYDRVDALNLGHPEYVRAALLAGLGFCAMPQRAVANDIAGGVIKRLPVPSVVRPITAIKRAGRGGPAQEAFWELLTGRHLAASATISADGHQS